MQNEKTISDFIKGLIYMAGGPQSVADLCGVTRRNVYKWPHRGVPREHIKTLANTLAIDVEDIPDAAEVTADRCANGKARAR